MKSRLFLIGALVLAAFGRIAEATQVGIQGGSTYPSIQAAVNAALDGNVILISTGTFYETVIVSNKDLVLEGGYDETLSMRVPGETVVNGQRIGTTLWIMDSSCRVDRVNITGGAGWPAQLWIGGGVLSHRSWIEFVDANIYSNTASLGGGMAVDVFSYAKMTGASAVYSNLAVFNGGGIWVDGRLDIVSDDADVFMNLATDGGGGGIWVETGYLRLFQGDVFGNQCGTSPAVTNMLGGGIGAVGSFIEMGDYAYVHDNSAGSGGGMAMIGSTAYVGRARAGDANFSYNLASHHGGGLYASNSTIHFQGATFWSNSAMLGGGGASLISSRADSDTNRLVVSYCRTGGDGGGFLIHRSDAHFSQAIFGEMEGWGNEAMGNGGGLYAWGSTVVVDGGLFRENRAPNPSGYPRGYGGGIALYFSKLTVTNGPGSVGLYTNTIFLGNAASTNFGVGGAIYVGDSCTCAVYGATMTSNFATEGAAIEANRYAECTILRSSFSHNRASRDGGAIELYMATAIVVRSSFQANTADEYGGAIDLSFGRLMVEGSRFVGNHAGVDGGAILLSGGSVFYGLCELEPLYNVTNGWPLLFQENTAEVGGGAIRAYGSMVMLQHAAFISNSAPNVGPALALNGCPSFIVKDSLMVNNANDSWGSLYVEDSTGQVFCSTLLNTNTALDIWASSVGVTNCILRGFFAPIWINGGTAIVAYCNVENGYAGPGNIDAEPQLYDNYHLRSGSPCINQGTPVATLTYDIDAEQRVGNYDIGFDEFVDTDGDGLPNITETGTGVWSGELDTGTKPNDPDSDGDHLGDGEEVFADTNPTDPTSYLGFDSIGMSAGGVHAQWHCGQAANISLEYSNDPHGGNWQLIQTYPPPTPNLMGENLSGVFTAAVLRVRAWR